MVAERDWTRWSIVLGFALGGFFDGILLHQILQWHHLLSLVDGLGDLRAQVLWDGYFHALMYAVALVALWGLWRSRVRAGERFGRRLVAGSLIGFGLWHIVDSILSHWLLGIHRIRLDSPDPLMWDLIWFVAFGLVPLAIGWLLLRGGGGSSGSLRGATTALLLAGLLTSGMAAWSLRQPADQRFTTIVFAPATGPDAVMAALVEADARLVWSDPDMAVVVADVPRSNPMLFYSRGALLVGGSGLPSGCFNWSRA